MTEQPSADANFAAAIREQRELRGWSQADLAQQLSTRGLNLHVTAVYKIETGQRKVSVAEAAVFAHVFDTSIDSLVASGRDALYRSFGLVRLESARLRRSVDEYTRAMADVALAADQAAELREPDRRWLETELTNQTPAKQATDALAQLRAFVSYNSIDVGPWMQSLLRAVEADEAALQPLWVSR